MLFLLKGSSGDPVVNKYAALGLGREAVILAVANYGDNPAKVKISISLSTELKDELSSIF